MGKPVHPQPVKLFTGVLSGDESLLPAVRERLQDQFGPIDFSSQEFSFDLTSYYEQELGKEIKRWFWSFEKLIDPGTLPRIKLFTNQVEMEFARDVSLRSVNLDPGYLDFYKLVLASVKDRAQKIYLARGIYADPTLYYLKGRWYAYDWSLPDFKTELYREVFQEIRCLYRGNMRMIRLGDVDFIDFDD